MKIHLLTEEGSDINEFLKSAQREKCIPRRVAFHAIVLLPVMPQDANCIFNQTCGFYLKQIQKRTERLGKPSVATFDMAEEKVKKNLCSSLFILLFFTNLNTTVARRKLPISLYDIIAMMTWDKQDRD